MGLYTHDVSREATVLDLPIALQDFEITSRMVLVISRNCIYHNGGVEIWKKSPSNLAFKLNFGY